MRIILAGAFGHLGGELLRSLVEGGHEVVAVGRQERPVDGVSREAYAVEERDVTDGASLKGLCDGADAVISTVGLTRAAAGISHYDVDYRGNLNLLEEAKGAGVKKFIYISVIHADQAPGVPMVHAKFLMEEALKKSGVPTIIYRPTGFFYDIVKVFRPMIEAGKVTLLGKKPIRANVMDTRDFADYITAHLGDAGEVVDVGGQETWTYEEIARMCFAAAGVEPRIKTAPPWLFDMLAGLPKNKRNGKRAVILFSKWTLSQDMVAGTKVGERSFKAYIDESFRDMRGE